MLDESQRLRENPHLLSLLSHYAQQGTEDRATWRDRLMQMEGIEPKQLSVLHGELIAFDWIEQNTGQASPMKDGVLANCYRITLNGLREYGRFHGVKIEVKAPETAEKKGPKFPRKKKQESDMPEAPVIAASEESPEAPETPENQNQESDSIEVPVVATLEESPETTETLEKKEPKFPGKKTQESDLPEAPVVAASEGSPEMPETLEMPEKKSPKSPRKKKQKSDSPEAPAVGTSEESLVPAA
jgi:hypothetical protein